MKSRCFWLWSPRTGATDIPRVGWLLGNTPLVGYSFASMTDESDETNGFLHIYMVRFGYRLRGPRSGSGTGSGTDESDESNGFGAHLLHVVMLGRPPPHRDRPWARQIRRSGLCTRPWSRVPDPGRNAPDTGILIMPIPDAFRVYERKRRPRPGLFQGGAVVRIRVVVQ